MTGAVRALRIAAGAGILAALVAVAALLLPHYIRDLRLKGAMKDIAARSENSDDSVRTAVVDSAARLGLGLRREQVKLTRDAGRLKIAVRYAVPVDMSVYAVDLHFQPSASSQ